MKARALAVGLVLTLAILTSCSGGNTESTPARQTLEAAQQELEKTPLEESVLQYARELCDPLSSFFAQAEEAFSGLDRAFAGEAEADIGTSVAAAALMAEGPLETFQDDLEGIDPPDELRAFHAAWLALVNFAISVIEAGKEGGFVAGFLSVGTAPPLPEAPEDLSAALVRECGEDLAEISEQLEGTFFDLP